MFTGIIEGIGQIKEILPLGRNRLFSISYPKGWEIKVSDSIAVEGVCLTVTEVKGDNFGVEVSEATLTQTTLKGMRRGDFANLERALLASGRLGGHFVQGHIDEIGRITKINRVGRNFLLTIQVSRRNLFLLTEKGSVAVSGISLTVFKILENTFQVLIIPHTYENTTLRDKRVGSEVNIEYDILGKYCQRRIC